MTRKVLLDTGVLVGTSNLTDPSHAACEAAWKSFRAELVSVEGVLTEATHLLRRNQKILRDAIGLSLATRVRLVPPTESRLRRAVELMARYSNVPMDFVDALLVAVAEEENISDVLTLDRRGFETYRIRGRGRFRIFPERS